MAQNNERFTATRMRWAAPAPIDLILQDGVWQQDERREDSQNANLREEHSGFVQDPDAAG